MKKILIFSHRSFPVSATFIYRQVQAAATHHKVHLVTMEVTNEVDFPMPEASRWVIKPYYGPLDRLIFYIQKRFYSYPLKFSSAAVRKFIKYVGHHNIDVIHIHYGTWAVHLLPVIKRLKIPVIVSFHGYDASSALKKLTYAVRLPELFKRVNRIVIVSDHMRDALNLSLWEKKVRLIPYGIDPQKFTRRNPRVSDEIKILHSGRITPKKGILDLIRVFSELTKDFSNISLHVLGDGIEKDDCVKLTDELNVSERVIFYGSRPLDDVIGLMAACHIFVLNSRIADNGDMEGLPNALLEAMSMEMAVISTYHAGIPMAVSNRHNGLLVKERDNERLKEALRLLIVDPELRLRLGFEARKTIQDKFTGVHMNKNLLALYEDLE